MVSLTGRQYVQQLSSDPYTQALADFLFGRSVSGSFGRNGMTADDVAALALQAIQDDEAQRFEEAYDEIKRRTPQPEADWIYNDLLLFALTLGVTKFDREPDWLLNVLQIRMGHSGGEKKSITQTLLDAINGNFESIDNDKPLMIVIKYSLSMNLGSEEYVNSAYQQAVENSFPRYESILLNIVCLRATDLIVFHKRLGNTKWYRANDAFLSSFKRRTHQMAYCFWFLLLLAVAGTTLYLWYQDALSKPEARSPFETAMELLALFGLPSLIVPVLTFRKQIVSYFERLLFGFFEYRVPEKEHFPE